MWGSKKYLIRADVGITHTGLNAAAGNKSAALEGGLAVAVPLELKGLWMAHQHYGRHAWGSLVAPAATLARNGFPAHPYLINALNETSVRSQ